MFHSMRIVSLGLLLCLGGAACSSGDRGGDRGSWGERGDGDAKQKKKQVPVTVVELATVGTGSVRETLAANAVVESESMADIIPMTTGIVVSLHQDEGDPVRKGALLAVLDNVTLDASAERARAEVSRLEEQHREMTELAARGAVSDRELSDITWNLENARTSLREAATTKGQTRLVAPFDGVVAARNVRVGELASGSAAAFTVVDLQELRVVAQVPERDLSRVAIDQTAELTSAYDERVVSTGTVSRIAPVVDSQSGTFRVTIAVDPAQTALRPGQYVNIDIEVDRKEGVVVVPTTSIVYEAGAPVVYAYDEATEEDLKPKFDAGGWGGGGGSWGGGGWGGGSNDDGDRGSWWASMFGDEEEAEEEEEDEGQVYVARRHPVELGLGDDDVVEVLSGIDLGAQIITVGQSHLRDGGRVRDAASITEKVADDAEAKVETPDEDQG